MTTKSIALTILRGMFILFTGDSSTVRSMELFEGDMILTKAQFKAAMEGGDVDSLADARKASKHYLWPGGVVHYSLEQQLKENALALEAIEDGVKQWTSKTCITFKERTDEKAFIYFFVGGSCSSEVGRTGNKQYVSIAPHCWNAGEVAHIIAHALGFYHEQSRPDRDEYVTINWDNIVESEKPNFAKYDRSRIDPLGVPYDYSSLMHFEATAFSKNGEPTITPKRVGVTVGQRKSPSVLDIKQMNLLYKCNSGGGAGGGGGSGGGGGGDGSGGGGGEGLCHDYNRRCEYWARIGECSRNPGYMKVYCKKSCRVCHAQGACSDQNRYCSQWAYQGYCHSNPGYMRPNCKRSCGLCHRS